MADAPTIRAAGGVIAHLTIRDGKAADAIRFLQARRSAPTEAMEPHMADDGKRIMHAHLMINGGHLMLNDDFPEYGDSGRRSGQRHLAPPGRRCRRAPGAAPSPPARSSDSRSPTSSGATATARSRIRSVSAGRSARRSSRVRLQTDRAEQPA